MIIFVRIAIRDAYHHMYLANIRKFYKTDCFEIEDCSPINEAIIAIEMNLEKSEKLIRDLKKTDQQIIDKIVTSLDKVEENIILIQKRVSTFFMRNNV